MIGVLLATVVTSYPEVPIYRRRRKECVGLAERNSMAEENVLILVELVVLAEHYPKILVVVAHATFPPKKVTNCSSKSNEDYPFWRPDRCQEFVKRNRPVCS
jgi:hypothetical protein